MTDRQTHIIALYAISLYNRLADTNMSEFVIGTLGMLAMDV